MIGEWARDKLTRWCLLTGNGEPWVWDFGSAARHHKIYAPWLPKNHCLAGLTGLRGAVSPRVGLFEQMAQEMKDVLEQEGVADMPLGIDVVEPPLLFALQKLGIEVRDGQQVMLDAREIKSHDEITLLNMAAAMGDGVYQDIFEALKPGVRENEIVAMATKRLYEMGSDCVEAINAIAGERCSPHPHNFTDRMIRPGDQAYFDIIQSYMGYRTCYYRTFTVGSATKAQHDAYKKARQWMDGAIAMLKPGVSTDKVAKSIPEEHRDRVRDRNVGVRPQLLPRPGTGPARAAAHLAAEFAEGPVRAQGRDGVRGRDVLPGDGRRIGRAHRGRSRADAGRREGHHAFPAQELPIANKY